MFRKLRFALRFRRAKKSLDAGRLDAAQALLVGLLDDPNSDPQKFLQVYAALAETELYRCHFLNSRYYARIFFEQYAQLAADVANTPEYKALVDRVRWCDEESQNPRQNPRGGAVESTASSSESSA